MVEQIENKEKSAPAVLYDEYMKHYPDMVSIYKDEDAKNPAKFAAWNGKKWSSFRFADVRDDILRMAMNLYENHKDVPGLAAQVMKKLTATIPATMEEEWDVSTRSIPLADGEWSISFEHGSMGNIVRTDKSHKMLTRLPIAKSELDGAGEQYKKSKLKGFLEDWLVKEDGVNPPCDDRLVFVQKSLGQALAGNPESAIHLWIGMGANGKSQLLKFIKACLGRYCTPMNTEDYIFYTGRPGHKEGLMCLRSIRVAMVGELESPNTILNGGTLKTHSGGDAFKARGMGQNSQEMVSNAMFIVFGNHDPIISDSSDGMKRRTSYIGFDYQIPEEDQIKKNEMLDILENEKHLMLHWIIEGAREYDKHGFGNTGIVASDTVRYFEGEDVLEEVLNRYCFETSKGEIEVRELFSKFNEKKENLPGIKSIRTLAKELRNRKKKLSDAGARGALKLLGYSFRSEGKKPDKIGDDRKRKKKSVKDATAELITNEAAQEYVDNVNN